MTPTIWQHTRYLLHRTGYIALLGLLLSALGWYAAPHVTEDAWVLWMWSLAPIGCVVGYGATQWGGAIVSILATTYDIDTPEKVDPLTLLRLQHEWVEGRKAVAERHGIDIADVLRGAYIRVTDERSRTADGTPASMAWWRQKTVSIAAKDLEDGLRHEFDHLLAGALFGERDDWGDLSHDERIALLEES